MSKVAIVKIDIGPKGEIRVSGSPATEAALSKALKAAIAKKPNVKLMIRPHKESKVERFHEILDIVKGAGADLRNVAFRVAGIEGDRRALRPAPDPCGTDPAE